MTADEKRAYQRGYNAGKRRKARQRAAERRQAAMDAFWQRAYLIALPFCMAAENWKRGDQKICSVSDRAWLASRFADDALEQAKPHI